MYTAGTSMSNRCSGAIVSCSLACVVGALVAPAPQGFGSRVLMYTDMCYGGLVWCLFALGADWFGGRVGCGCGLWLRCSLDGPCQESRVSGFGVWLGLDSCWGFGLVRRL